MREKELTYSDQVEEAGKAKLAGVITDEELHEVVERISNKSEESLSMKWKRRTG